MSYWIGLFLIFSTVLSCAKPKYDRTIAPQFAKRVTQKFETPVCDKKIESLNLCLELVWLVPPQDGATESIIELRLYQLDNLQALQIKELNWSIETYVSMPSMAHRNYVLPKMSIATSKVRIANLYFKMAGFWKIQFHLKNQFGQTLAIFEESVLAGSDICTTKEGKP